MKQISIINKQINIGFKILLQHNGPKEAWGHFASVLSMDSDHVEAKIGILLCDLATDFPELASELIERYISQRDNGVTKRKRQKDMLKKLKAIDSGANFISKLRDEMMYVEANEINGVLYRDFKKLIKNGDFKSAFQNIIFSSKIVFVNKNEFYDFLYQLIKHDYKDLSLEYIEGIKEHSMFDEKADKLLRKIYP